MRIERTRLGVISAMVLLTVTAMGPGCASRKEVVRVSPDTTIDLSGRWNDADSRQVADTMIQDCLAGNWIVEHATQNGRRPVIIVGAIRNQSLEHIPTGTFVADIERAMVNSGKIDVVATAEERSEIREERVDQWENASEETVKEMGRERGADYMLAGTVQSIEDKEGGAKVVFYQVDLTLIDIESNRKAWIGQEKIKKTVSQGHFAP